MTSESSSSDIVLPTSAPKSKKPKDDSTSSSDDSSSELSEAQGSNSSSIELPTAYKPKPDDTDDSMSEDSESGDKSNDSSTSEASSGSLPGNEDDFAEKSEEPPAKPKPKKTEKAKAEPKAKNPKADTETTTTAEPTKPKAKAKPSAKKLDPGEAFDENGEPRYEYLYAHAVNNSRTNLKPEDVKAYVNDPKTRGIAIEAMRVWHLLNRDKKLACAIRDANCKQPDDFWTDINKRLDDLSDSKKRAAAIKSCVAYAEEHTPIDKKAKPVEKAKAELEQKIFVEESLLTQIKLKYVMPALTKAGSDLVDATVLVLMCSPAADTETKKRTKLLYDPPPIGDFNKVTFKRLYSAAVGARGGYMKRPNSTRNALCMFVLGDYIVKQISWLNTEEREELCRVLFELEDGDKCAEHFNCVFDGDIEAGEFASRPNQHVQDILDNMRQNEAKLEEERRKRDSMLTPKSRTDGSPKPKPKAKSKAKSKSKAKEDGEPAHKKQKSKKPPASPKKRKADESEEAEVEIIAEQTQKNPQSVGTEQRVVPQFFYLKSSEKENPFRVSKEGYGELVDQFERTMRMSDTKDFVSGLANGTAEAGTTSAQKTVKVDADGIERKSTTPKTALHKQSTRSEKSLRAMLTAPQASSEPRLGSEAEKVKFTDSDKKRMQNTESLILSKMNASTLALEDSVTSEELHHFVSDALLRPEENLCVADALRVLRAYSSAPKIIARVICEKNRQGTLFGDASATEIDMQTLLGKVGEQRGFTDYTASFMLHYANLTLVVEALLLSSSAQSYAQRLVKELVRIPALGQECGNGFDPLVMWNGDN